MDFDTLIYVTNGRPPESGDPPWLRSLHKLGFKDTTCVVTGNKTDWEESLRGLGLRCSFIVDQAPSASSILQNATEKKASLIATDLTTAGASISRRSILRDLLRTTRLPLLVIPDDPPGSTPEDVGIFAHVIFATDWAPFSQNCMNALLGLRGVIGELEIVTVINRKLSIRDMIKLKDSVEEARETFVDQGIDAEAHIYAGRPSAEVVLAAKDYSGTSIVMGTSQSSAWRTLFCGNCTYEVADRAVVPALFVP